MLNPISRKKVRGQEHPGWLKIAERKIPSVKILFKTNTNGHKHTSIGFINIEQDTIGETKENNEWHSTQERRTPKSQSYGLWWGAVSQILNDTVYVYIRPITRTRINNAYG